jgi:DNA segregation ATPase FtsK/SpoIIIE, S-DNA-T family
MANKLKKSTIPKPVEEEKDDAEKPARTVRANAAPGKKPAPHKFKKEKEEKIDLKKLARDERTWKIIGTISLLISFFLFIAFVSYFFTWKEDQDKVINNNASFLWDMDDESQVSNLLGRLGAYVSHFFIYRGFGVASLLFCTFFFVSGINLLLNRKVFSVWRNLKYVTFGLLIASVSLSFLFSNATFPFGGGVGDMISNWLINLIGYIGTTVLLLAVAGAYLIWQFNPSFNVPSKRQQPNSNINIEEEDTPSLKTSGDSLNDVYAGKGNVLTGNEKMNYQKEEDEDEFELTELEDEDELINEDGIEKEIVDDILHRDDDRIVQKPNVTKGNKPIGPGSGLELEIKVGNEKKEDELIAIAPAELEPYEPTLDLRDYKHPKLEFLETHGSEKIVQDPTELEANKNQIIRTLQNYDITIQKISATVGPTVTLYEIVPAAGVRISRIKNLEDDIALSLAALGIRIIAPIPGKGTIGIEVPNHKKSVVSMKTMLGSEKFTHNNFSLPIAIGKRIDNELFIVDLASMPHLLMAGATGQGKSVGLNAILVSLLYKKHPSQLKLVLIDPKKVELSVYRHIERFFLAKLPGEEDAIITDTKKVVNTLNSLCIEMDNRYDLLKEAGARNIKEYNEKFIKRKLNPQKGHQFLPFIVLVIDEFADLIMTAGKEIEMPIARLAQLARAVGLHLIIATQRPSVNIITGTIKANFPSRIAFKVSSKIDSRTILDAGGAEQLIGKGDMLISHNGEIVRLQCAFVDTPEVERIVDFISEQRGYPQAFMLPEYIDEKDLEGKDFDASDRDPLFEDAARLIVQNQVGSTSLLQRRMKLGYNRAGRLMDQLEAAGIVGANVGSKARDVLYKTEAELLEFLESLR